MTQDTLFPITDLKTEGYAQPEPREDAEAQAAESDDNFGAEAA